MPLERDMDRKGLREVLVSEDRDEPRLDRRSIRARKARSKSRVIDSANGSYPPDVFERVTDLLAELVLEDIGTFCSVAALGAVDTIPAVDNTSALTPRQLS
jgi:hypothetical protein